MPQRRRDQLRLLHAHLRLFLIRYRVLYWVVALACAALVGWSVHRQQQAAALARAGWEERAPVLVLAAAIDPGEPITDGLIDMSEAPRHLVPVDHLDAVPEDAIARVRLTEGTILTQALIIEPGRGLDADHRGVALPIGATTPPLHPGQRVDLVSSRHTLSAAVQVLDADEDRVLVAVPGALVTAVTTAARLDDLTIVLSS